MDSMIRLGAKHRETWRQHTAWRRRRQLVDSTSCWVGLFHWARETDQAIHLRTWIQYSRWYGLWFINQESKFGLMNCTTLGVGKWLEVVLVVVLELLTQHRSKVKGTSCWWPSTHCLFVHHDLLWYSQRKKESFGTSVQANWHNMNGDHSSKGTSNGLMIVWSCVILNTRTPRISPSTRRWSKKQNSKQDWVDLFLFPGTVPRRRKMLPFAMPKPLPTARWPKCRNGRSGSARTGHWRTVALNWWVFCTKLALTFMIPYLWNVRFVF